MAETAPKGGDCAQDPACRPVGRLGMQKSLSVEEIRTSSRSKPRVTVSGGVQMKYTSRQVDAAWCGPRHAILV